MPRPWPTPRWLSPALLVLLSVTLSVYAWSIALDAYPATCGGDGPFQHEMLEAARYSVARYHELPLWNPYQCGGVPLWDNPAGTSSSPIVWLLLWLMNTTHAMVAWFIVHTVMGFFCMWAFARRELRLTIEASLVAAAAWAYAGVHTQHENGGALVYSPYLYFPLAIHLWRRAEYDVRMAIALGGLVAWTMHEGGTYPLPHLALFLGLETLTRALPPRRLRGIVRAAAIVGVAGFLFGASRFLAGWAQLQHHTRDLHVEHDALKWETLKSMFLDRTHTRWIAGQEYVWPEFGAYLGPFILALALLGLLLSGFEHLWLVWITAWAFALMLGHAGPWAPWSFFKGHVFPFKEMRVPSRFNVTVTMGLTAFAGLAVDRLTRFVTRSFASERATQAARAGLLAVAFIGIGDEINSGFLWNERNGFHAPAEDTKVTASPRFFIDGPGLADFIDEPRQNRGRSACWEEWAFEAGAPIWAGDVPQAKAADDGAAVSAVTRTQNSFTIDVEAKRPARVWLNSGYDRGWRASVGEVVREGKLLAVDVPAGRHHLVVRYWPHGLTLGLLLSGASLLAVAAYLARELVRRYRRPAPPAPVASLPGEQLPDGAA